MATYRSAQGKQVDMSQLASKHEKVRAVGNMNVNARGDVIDSQNRVVKDNTNRVKNTYKKTTVNNAPKPVRNNPQPPIKQVNELSKEEQELFNENDEDIEK